MNKPRVLRVSPGTAAALRHPCPLCCVAQGVRCINPKGEPREFVHIKRMDLVRSFRPCPHCDAPPGSAHAEFCPVEVAPDPAATPGCPPMDSYIVPQQGPQPGIGALTPDGVPGVDRQTFSKKGTAE